MTQLKDSRLVMLWQRVNDLDRSLQELDELGLNWKAQVDVAGCTHAISAGTVILGRWQQDFDSLHARKAARMDFKSFEMAPNSASELVIVSNSSSLEAATRSLRRRFDAERAPVEAAVGRSVSTVDSSGNVLTLLQPNDEFLSKREPRNAEFIMGYSMSEEQPNPIAVIRRHTENLDRSAEFYKSLLEMPYIGGDREIRFRPGLCELSLVEEPLPGATRALNKIGRLSPDWMLMHVWNIEKTAAELESKGIHMPFGIERTSYGPLIYVSDPDGHPVVYWQQYEEVPPQGNEVRPEVNRILTELDRGG